jgi:protein O-GlcNAc transferase
MNQNLAFLLNKALEQLRNSNFGSAELYLKQGLKLSPESHDVLRLLGVTAAQQGNHIKALNYFNEALKYSRRNPIILSNLANVYLALKNYDEALDFYDKALKIDDKNPEVWSNKGNALYELKQYEDALYCHDKALSFNPFYAEGLSNKGNALFELKQYQDAIKNYEEALNLKPNYADGWFNKGNAFLELKLYEEAIISYDAGLKLNPNHALAWSDMGNALRELGRLADANANYKKALFINPDLAEVWQNLGVLEWELKNYEKSITYYEKALNLKPEIEWVPGYLLNVKMVIAQWDNFNAVLDDIIKGVKTRKKIIQPFGFFSLIDDPDLHKQSNEIYAQNRYPHNPLLGSLSKQESKKKIRVAYVSTDFRTHPVAFLTAQLFSLHNRDQFEIFAISLQNAPNDAMHQRLRSTFDHFIDAKELSDPDIAQLGRNLEIDIAVDMGGFTQFARPGIFSYRVAPIQVSWLGYPGTLGSDYIDYLVADKTVIPDSMQQYYSEKVAYLPDSYLVDDETRISSSRVYSKSEFGLPENSFVFCSFNNSYKFNGQLLDGWSRILQSVHNSVIWIPENNELFKLNIKKEFQQRKIDGTRIIFSKRLENISDHLVRISLADLFLDTYPFNAHSTGIDSLKAGVPIVTLIGNSFASRVAASLLNAIGLPELIASTQDQYEALAIELALNPDKLSAIKLKLAKNKLTEPLFNTPLFTRNLESLYTKMYNRYHDGLEPDHISLS